MKKLMVFLLVGCLALLVGGSIFAINPVDGVVYDHSGEGDLDLSGRAYNNADVGAAATLKAYVTPYAKVTFGTQQDETTPGSFVNTTAKGLVFSGQPNETKSGRIVYTLETNCDVNVDGMGTAFKGNTFGNYLSTSYLLQPANDNANANSGYDANGWREIHAAGYVWAPEAFDHTYLPVSATPGNGTNPGNYNVFFKATTGDRINSQRAGNYTATYVVTVWAPHADSLN